MGAFQVFHQYMGSGLILIWYLCAVLFLAWKEQRRQVRVLFVYFPLLTLALFFNPLFYKLYDRFMGGETIFRILWLLPVSITISYGVIRICGMLTGKKRVVFAGVSFFMVIVTGTLVYRNPLFSKAENLHHVPSEVVQICDMIKVDGREVMAVFPAEFLLYVRQYSADVCMPYGRESMQGVAFDDFYQYMLGDEISAEVLAWHAKEEGCHYVIFSDRKKIVGRLEDYEYELFGQVGEYLIYRDPTMDFRNTMD